MKKLLLLIAALLLAQIVIAQQPTILNQAQVKGSITGRVIDQDGQPVANIDVIFLSSGPNHSRTQVMTDSEGRFRTDELAPGLYSINCTMPGYVQQGNAGRISTARPGDTVTLTLRKGGVITGRVTDANDDPIVGATVEAILMQNEAGAKIIGGMYGGRPMLTDDRGIYRIYGLVPGIYFVRLNNKLFTYEVANPIEGDLMTYYPSASFEEATEIRVNYGDEITGIDLRHRGQRGFVVSGIIVGTPQTQANQDDPGMPSNYANVALRSLVNRATVATTSAGLNSERREFRLIGVPEGEYELSAEKYSREDDGARSEPRRVIVRGSDISGIELTLTPLGSIAGQLELAPNSSPASKEECKAQHLYSLAENVITARRSNVKAEEQTVRLSTYISRSGQPDEQGNFVVRGIEAGHYYLGSILKNETWYVRAMSLTGADGKAKGDVARSGVAIKVGEKVTGLKVTVAEGAAGLKGKVVSSASLPQRLRVYLIPAERSAADDLVKYYETVSNQGGFSFGNIAPGRYWIVAQELKEDESGLNYRPLAWDTNTRAELRRQAEAANIAVELSPCQRLTDFTLPYIVNK